MAYTEARLKQVLKKHLSKGENEVHIPTVAAELGEEPSAIAIDVWKLEPEVAPRLKFKANKQAILKSRKPKSEGGDGMRWERIAARTGLSISELKAMGGDAAANTYTGRGRMPGSNGAKATSGRRQAKDSGNKGQSGRRQAAAKGKAQAGRKPRARTRAERAAKSGDPK